MGFEEGDGQGPAQRTCCRSCLGRRRSYAQQSRAEQDGGERQRRTVAQGKEGSEPGEGGLSRLLPLKSSPPMVLLSKDAAAVSWTLELKIWE